MQALTAAEKVERGREAVYERFVFLAPPIASWRVHPTYGISTAATNGPDLFYSPTFVDQLTVLDMFDLMLHEAGHVILGHSLRMGKRDPKLWNEACDLAVHDRFGRYMQANGYIRTHGLWLGEGKYAHLPAGMSAEWYYDTLLAEQQAEQAQQQQQGKPEPQEGQGSPQPQQPGQQPQDGGDDQGEAGDGDEEGDGEGEASGQAEGESEADVKRGTSAGQGDGQSDPAEGTAAASGQDQEADGQGDGQEAGQPAPREAHSIGEVMPTPGDPKEAEQAWERVVAQSVLAATEAGTLPGWAKELADEMLGGSEENWRAIMRRFFTQLVPTRSNYSHVNRRTAWRSDVVFPDPHSIEAAPGCVLTDTSGSMSTAAMNVGLQEMSAILTTFPYSEVTLRMADTELYEAERVFHRWDFPITVPVEWLGRGGTDLAAAITEIAESRKYKWIAVVSDMRWDVAGCPDPGMPVLWVTTEDISKMASYSTPTFGQVIGPVAA